MIPENEGGDVEIFHDVVRCDSRFLITTLQDVELFISHQHGINRGKSHNSGALISQSYYRSEILKAPPHIPPPSEKGKDKGTFARGVFVTLFK